MYGKIFTEIFDSSLMAEGGWLSTYVFMCMISFADKKGHVRHDPRTLYRRIGLNIDERVSFNEFMDALDFLEAEDDLSNLSNHEGKRILNVADIEEIEGKRGWVIVNYVHYRDKGGSLEQRRSNDAARKRRERENNNLEEKTQESHVTSAHTDTDTDVDKDINPSAWSDYEQHRKEKKKPITPLSKTKQQNILRKHPFDEQQAMVDKAIANGWTGIYPAEKSASDKWGGNDPRLGVIK